MDEKIARHVKANFSGSGSIRAFGKCDVVRDTYYDYLWTSMGIYRAAVAANNRKDTVREFFTAPGRFLVYMACVYMRGSVDTLMLCLILQRSEWIDGITQHLINLSFETEKSMKAVQKLVNLEGTVQEIEEGEVEVKANWPVTGRIEF